MDAALLMEGFSRIIILKLDFTQHPVTRQSSLSQRLDTDYIDKNNGPGSERNHWRIAQQTSTHKAVLHNCVIISVIEQETARIPGTPLWSRRFVETLSAIRIFIHASLSDRSAARSPYDRCAHKYRSRHVQTGHVIYATHPRTHARCYLLMLPAARHPSHRRFHRYKLLNYKFHYEWWFSLLSHGSQLQ